VWGVSLLVAHPLLLHAVTSAAAGPSVSEGCRQELAAFKADRASNVNKDLALAKVGGAASPGPACVCGEHHRELCADASLVPAGSRAGMLCCGSNDVAATCQVQACRDDIKTYCKKVGPGGDPAELLDCLRRSKKKVQNGQAEPWGLAIWPHVPSSRLRLCTRGKHVSGSWVLSRREHAAATTACCACG